MALPRLALALALLPLIPAQDSRSSRSSKDGVGGGVVEMGLGVEPGDVEVEKGGVAAFHCAAFGAPADQLTLSWRKDGQIIRPSDSASISMLENGTLIVRDVSGKKGADPGSEGSYQCLVSADKGERSLTFLSRKARLRVHVLPRFVEQPVDRAVEEGQSVLFPCRTNTRPPPSVRWYKDGALLAPDSPGLVHLPFSGSLQIVRAKPEDAGVYRCKVSSSDKYRESTEGKLTVKSSGELPDPAAPTFEVKPGSSVVSEGESVVLECAANGYPEPEIQWLKDERLMALGGRLRREGAGSLVIENVGISDAGVYTCRASSTLDSLDATATIQVQVPPSFTKQPENVVAKETADVEFECKAAGEPGPALTWFKNGELIEPSEYFVIEGNRLKVLGLVKMDSGVYQCMADNPAGSVQASAQLYVQVAERVGGGAGAGGGAVKPTSELPEASGAVDSGSDSTLPPPSEPQQLSATDSSSRHVALSWSSPAVTNGPITAYSLFYKEDGSDRERVLNVTEVGTTSARIDNLQPGATYKFRVVAYNANGHGLSSAPLTLATKAEEAVPGVVRSLRAFPTSSESMEIRWEPPKTSDSNPIPVSFYKLFYSQSPDPTAPPQMETEIQVSREFYALHGLGKFRWYSFRVEAHGGAGEGSGPSSETVRARTLSDLPSGPPLGVEAEPGSAQTIVVTWEPPAESDRNGLITGYKIRYKEKSRGSAGRTLVTDGSAREQRISGLDAGSGYQVRVAAMTGNGTGPASPWVRAETYDKERGEDTVPGPPTALRVQARARSILISWTPPLEDGVLTRGFIIGWGINVPDVEQTKVDGTRNYYTINDLMPQRNYIISLRAYNRRGNGFPIYETVRTRDSDEEGNTGTEGSPVGELHEPIGLRADTTSATSIRLSWTDRDLPPPLLPTDAQVPRDGRKYQVRFKSYYLNNARYHYINSTETILLVDGLKPATQYEFNVATVHGSTSSGWSMLASNTTESAAPTSAPRDLTANPSDDPTSLVLSWQPPRHPNGKINEYLIYYTDQPTLPDRQWRLEGVRGDTLSTTLADLLPKTTYYFKIQAVSDKGYGPLSAVIQKRTVVGGASHGKTVDPGTASGSFFEGQQGTLIIAVAAVTVVLLLIICAVGIWCCRRPGNDRNRNGYVQGKKTHASKMEVKPPPDLWIHHEHARRGSGDELEVGSTRGNSIQDLKDFSHPHHMQQSPALYRGDSGRYQTHSELGSRMSQSAMDYADGTMETRQVGRARPIRHAGSSTNTHNTSDSSKGTLTRSYHQSSGSLEDGHSEHGMRQPHSARQRTPNVVYTGPRHGASGSVDLDGLTPTPPPSLPPGTALVDSANRTLTRSGHPLKSFSHLTAGVGPPLDSSPGPARALVRPVPITVLGGGQGTSSPLRSVGTSASGKPAGIVIGTKAVRHTPSHYPGGSVSDAHAYSSGKDTDNELQHSYSTEDLNVQMENLDTLMEDLHAMSKNEFNVA